MWHPPAAWQAACVAVGVVSHTELWRVGGGGELSAKTLVC